MLRAQPDTNEGGEKRSIDIPVFIDIESDDSKFEAGYLNAGCGRSDLMTFLYRDI